MRTPRHPRPHTPTRQVSAVGTPLTHERYLRRARGSYGPGIKAGEGFFPGPSTPVAVSFSGVVRGPVGS
jgi:hypothetical protein